MPSSKPNIERVVEIETSNLKYANQCHEPFTVDSVLLPTFQSGRIHYIVQSVTPYQKQYPPNEIDYGAYIHDADRTVFFAFIQDALGGAIVVSKWWNNFAYIEDLSVRGAFRRRGIGRALVARVMEWAKVRHLPGVMLETQNNNVSACRCSWFSRWSVYGCYVLLAPNPAGEYRRRG
jgi:ribosomal protein S18 acetylase RimI-like enzyme